MPYRRQFRIPSSNSWTEPKSNLHFSAIHSWSKISFLICYCFFCQKNLIYWKNLENSGFVVSELWKLHQDSYLSVCTLYIFVFAICIFVCTYLFINILGTFLSFVVIIRLKIRRNFHLFSTVCVWIKVLRCLQNTIFFRPVGRSEYLAVKCRLIIFRKIRLFSIWLEYR